MSVYVVVHITAPMVYDLDESKSPPTSSYTKTVEILKKLAIYGKRKGGCSFITYIGKRKILQADLKKEDPLRSPSEILEDAVYLGDQLEEIRLENDIFPEDTMILFTNAAGYLVNCAAETPCRTQLVIMDKNYDDITKPELLDLQAMVDASMDPLVKATRAKDFKTLHFCKAKNGEVVYRIVKDHLMQFTTRIWVGKLKQPVVFDPPCKLIPKGNLFVVGFLKSSSLANMPILSKHIMLQPSLIGVTRKQFKEGDKKKNKKKKKKVSNIYKKINNQKDKKRFLGTLYMLKELLAKNDCVALARHQSGVYCAIYSLKADADMEIQAEFGIAVLDVLKEFKFDELMPLQVVGKLDDLNVQDLHVKVPTDTEMPSYTSNVKCWTSSQGINADLQKIIRIFRKIEKEKLETIYWEVNRFREYATFLGMIDFMKSMGEVIRTQTATMSELAQKHGKHIANYFEKDCDSTGRYETIPIFVEKMPEKEKEEMFRKPHREHRHDRDDRHHDRHESYRHGYDRRSDRYERRHR